MPLTKPAIIEWCDSYDKNPDNDNKSERKILSEIDTVKTWENFKDLLLNSQNGILRWKSPRSKPYYNCLDSAGWQKLFCILKDSAGNPKEAVKSIVRFAKENMSLRTKSGVRKGGINYQTASALAYFFSKRQLPNH